MTPRGIITLIVLALAIAGGAGLYCAGKADGGRTMKIEQLEAKQDTVETAIAEATQSRERMQEMATKAAAQSEARRERRRRTPVRVIDSTTIKLGNELLTAEPRVISIIAEDKAIQADDSITVEIMHALVRRLERERDAWKQDALIARELLALERSGKRMRVVKIVGTTVVLTLTLVGGILAIAVL